MEVDNQKTDLKNTNLDKFFTLFQILQNIMYNQC